MSTAAEITTDEALAVAVALLQAKQASMNDFAVRRAERIEASQPGRGLWRRKVSQTVEHETDDLIERHGQQMLASTETLLRQADRVALAGQPIHLVDFDTIGTRSMTVGGFTMAAGVYDVLRPILPADAQPGPVIAVNVRAELHDATANLPADTSEGDIVATAAWWVAGTALHEYAHVVTEQAADRHIESPLVRCHPDRIQAIALALEETQSVVDQAQHHPPEWVRACFHLAHRSGIVERFVADVGRYYHNPEAIAAALTLEALMADFREPIIDILRRPEPTKFAAAIQPKFTHRSTDDDKNS